MPFHAPFALVSIKSGQDLSQGIYENRRIFTSELPILKYEDEDWENAKRSRLFLRSKRLSA